MSGFADDAFGEADLPAGVTFLAMAFTAEVLARSPQRWTGSAEASS